MNVTHLHNNSIPYLEISNSSKIFEIFNTKRKSNNIPERFKKRFSIISNPHMTVSKSEESYAETEDKLKGNLNDSSKRSNDDITITDKSEEVDESGGESSKKFKTGRWTEEEHKKFMEAIMIYGNDWKKVQKVLMTRSSIQARSHAQKFFLRVRKYLNLLKKECSNGELFSEIKKESVIRNIDVASFDIIWRFICEIKEEPKKAHVKGIGPISSTLAKSLTNNQKRAIINIVLQFSSESEIIKSIKKRKSSKSMMDGKKDFLKENLNKLLGLNNSCKAASKIFNITKEKRVSKEKSDVSSESKESEFTSNMNQIAAWNLKDIIGIKKIADDYIKNSFFNDRHIHVNQDPQDIHRAPSYNTYVNSLTDNEQRCSANIYDELKLLYVNKQKNQNKFQELERETQKVSSKPESFIKLLNNESILENVNFFSTIKSKNCLKLEPNESKEETCNPFNLNFFNNFNPVSDNEKSLYEEDSLNFHDYGMFK